MKFASFETIVEAIYGYLPGKKSDYGRGAQTGVSFAGGYLAGILCAVVSHPADVMVSKLNAQRQPGEAFGAAMGRIYKDSKWICWGNVPTASFSTGVKKVVAYALRSRLDMRLARVQNGSIQCAQEH